MTVIKKTDFTFTKNQIITIRDFFLSIKLIIILVFINSTTLGNLNLFSYPQTIQDTYGASAVFIGLPWRSISVDQEEYKTHLFENPKPASRHLVLFVFYLRAPNGWWYLKSSEILRHVLPLPTIERKLSQNKKGNI